MKGDSLKIDKKRGYSKNKLTNNQINQLTKASLQTPCSDVSTWGMCVVYTCVNVCSEIVLFVYKYLTK